jgi:prevent-host-death family protein
VSAPVYLTLRANNNTGSDGLSKTESAIFTAYALVFLSFYHILCQLCSPKPVLYDGAVVKFTVVFYECLVYSTDGGAYIMPNIKPISELRNYGEVLRDVAVGSPVFLTKNGHGRYAVMDIEEYKEYEKMLSWRTLKAELEKGKQSGVENGWIDAGEVRARLEERYRG